MYIPVILAFHLHCCISGIPHNIIIQWHRSSASGLITMKKLIIHTVLTKMVSSYLNKLWKYAILKELVKISQVITEDC